MSDMIKTKATFADYMAMPESNQIVELIDGEIIVKIELLQHVPQVLYVD